MRLGRWNIAVGVCTKDSEADADVLRSKVLYGYGQYQDDWIKTCCPEEWRIKARTLVYMVCSPPSQQEKREEEKSSWLHSNPGD